MSGPLGKSIGVRIDDLKSGVKSGIRCATQMGFSAAEVAADSQEVCPSELSETGRSHLARLVRSGNMAFSALSHNAGFAELTDVTHLNRAVESTKEAIRLAADMRVPTLSKGLGPLSSVNERDRDSVIAAIWDVSKYAERFGTTLAIHSRFGGTDSLIELVQQIACPGLQIAIDPGELISAGVDPLAAASATGDQLALAYIRDAQVGTPEHAGSEVPLGQGSLDLQAYLAHLSLHAGVPAPILRRNNTADAQIEIATDRQFLLDSMQF
ncbi:MAG: hypothetical protein DHS20C16_28010 [Phycisphaerae bacterium]|nr:MAG: hypothetical protein DHS20C16_28010 [Phycisphaerae bacterium]